MNVLTEPDDLTPEADDGAPVHPLFADAPRSVSFNKLRKRLLRQVRQAMEDFSMLKGQKRWLVALSGGKDSYGLLALLLDLKWRGMLPVDLLAAAPSVQPPQNDPAAHWRDARSGPGRLPPSLLSPILRI